jgi:hypothetical protein
MVAAVRPPRFKRRRSVVASAAVLTIAFVWLTLAPRSHVVLFTLAVIAGAAAAVLLLETFLYVFDRWMFGGRSYNQSPRYDAAIGKWTFRNWDGNQTFAPKDIVSPRSLEELLGVVGQHACARSMPNSRGWTILRASHP